MSKRPSFLRSFAFSCGLLALPCVAGTEQLKEEALVAHYSDPNQQVWTMAARTWLRLSDEWSLGIKGLGDLMVMSSSMHAMHASGEHDHDGASTDDMEDMTGDAGMDMDAISGASMRAHSAHGSLHGRGEATVSLRRDFAAAGMAFLGGGLHYSGESDYQAVQAFVNGGRDFFERNTSVTGTLAGGMDVSHPAEAPPGEAERWPAASTRWSGAMQVGQLLSPRSQLGLSYSFTAMLGPQENPYRRALVVTSLFPERLPQKRFRHVMGAEIGYYLGRGVGFFHREGVYLDSWGVKAWIPETALPIEVGERWLVTPKYRYFRQTAASFHRTVYEENEGWLSGDGRLSRLEGNEAGLEVEYQLAFSPAEPALSVSALYSDSRDLDLDATHRSLIVAVSFRRALPGARAIPMFRGGVSKGAP